MNPVSGVDPWRLVARPLDLFDVAARVEVVLPGPLGPTRPTFSPGIELKEGVLSFPPETYLGVIPIVVSHVSSS
jgi:hypothetical protein